MTYTFCNKRISSILSILPNNIVRYEDELGDYNFPIAQSKRLGMMMDYNTRREIYADETLVDYVVYGLKHLFEKNVVNKEDIDALVVVSSSQDYIMPSASYVIQGQLGLRNNIYCCDIAQVCGGYIYGLMQAFMLIDSLKLKKVVLVTGDTLTKKICKRDRNSRPIIGDCVNVSIIEPCESSWKIFCNFLNYGELCEYIKIPAGGFKYPSNENTSVETIDEQGNYRAMDHFYMDGENVFNFVMTYVPPVINEILAVSNNTIESIDYFMFHQPNKYMVDRLAQELDIPNDKCPDNIVGIYGNSSTGTIPLNICHNISAVVQEKTVRICLSGFGAGLTCNAMIINNPPMSFCGMIDYAR